MAAVASKATGNPNPTSAQYAAQRGSMDMLMRPKEAKAPTSSNGGDQKTGKSGSGAVVAAEPKMSFLEAIRAQRQVRVQQLRDMPKTAGPGSLLAIKSAASVEAPSSFYKGSGGGSFSALASSSNKSQKKESKSKPPGNRDTTWVEALSMPTTQSRTKITPDVTTATITTAIGAATSNTSFAQVQDELEAGFQRYSRANPLGGVGSGYSAKVESSSQNMGRGRGSHSNQNQSQQGSTMPPTTATSRNLKARQLMVAPASRREEEKVANVKKKHFSNGGDDSSDEDVGRSALGRAKKSRKG
ncbi:hypothetical protein SEPCBS57363_005308 [Sporothrix epigloea]|uniref:Uncharacterized protein n=1 Tax=Sporothrix epigloea TaxID=1892477 RepID=A0ABP0DYQ0_9PEZI